MVRSNRIFKHRWPLAMAVVALVVLAAALFAAPAAAQGSAPFITTWETTADGESIIIPTATTDIGGGYSYTVAWGDGQTDSGQIGDASHTYATAGTHTVTISGDFPRIYMPGNSAAQGQIRTVQQWGTQEWTSMASAFEGVTNFEIRATDSPTLTAVTDMSRMFKDAANFTGAHSNIGGVDGWDVSDVENMRSMFGGAAVFNSDLSQWDVANVTNMSLMFAGAAKFNANIIEWDVAEVTNMGWMFYGAAEFSRHIGGINGEDVWNVSKVENMRSMFYGAAAFDEDLGDWDISSITSGSSNMLWMFNQAQMSPLSYSQTLLGWSTLNEATETRIPTGITLGAGGKEYTGIAQVARAKLVAEVSDGGYGWTITDGGVFDGGNISLSELTLQDADTQTAVDLDQEVGLPTIAYTATVESEVSSLTVSATAGDATVALMKNGSPVDNPVPLNAIGQDTEIVITVTSRLGAITQEYTLTITRAGGTGDIRIELDIVQAVDDADTFGGLVEGDDHRVSSWVRVFYIVPKARGINPDGGTNPQLSRVLGSRGYGSPEFNFSAVHNVTGTRMNFLYHSDCWVWENEVEGNPDRQNWWDEAGNVKALEHDEVWPLLKSGSKDDEDKCVISFAADPSLSIESGVYTVTLEVPVDRDADGNEDDDPAVGTTTLTIVPAALTVDVEFDDSDATVSPVVGEVPFSVSFSDASGGFISDAGLGAGCIDYSLCDHKPANPFVSVVSVEGDLTPTPMPTGTADRYPNAYPTSADRTANEDHSAVTYSGTLALVIPADTPAGEYTVLAEMLHVPGHPGSESNMTVSLTGQATLTVGKQFEIEFSNLQQDAKSLPGGPVTVKIIQRDAPANVTKATLAELSVSGSDNRLTGVTNPGTSSAVSFDNSGDDAVWTWTLNVPGNANFGNYTVTATTVPQDHDGSSSTPDQPLTDSETLTITRVVVANPIGDRTAIADSLFRFTFPANTFGDSGVDSDSLSYSASGMPSWLSFDADTRTFSGTPTAAADAVTVSATLTDTNGNNSATDTFELTVEAADDNAFITTWEGRNITIPTATSDIGAGYSYNVNWGDGLTTDTRQTRNASHTYIAAGEYTVSITGDFPRIYINGGDAAGKIKSVEQWGNQEWTSMAHAFKGALNLTIADAAGKPDLSLVTDMSYMFENAYYFNSDISHWDVDTVTNMERMFLNNISFNQDLGASADDDWNVANVRNFHNMFSNASVFNGDLSEWNPSAATNMNSMFYEAIAFNGDLSEWSPHVSNVTNFSNMFGLASAFTGTGGTDDRGIRDWVVSSGTNFRQMFLGARAFTGDVSGWDVSSGEDFASMFSSANAFNQNLGGWDISSVDDETSGRNPMVSMFNNTALDTTNYDATLIGWSQVTGTETKIPSGIDLGLVKHVDDGKVEYSGAAAQLARAILTEDYGWEIDDGGVASGADISLSSLRQSTGQFAMVPAIGALSGTEYTATEYTAKDYAVTVVSIADEMILSPSPTDTDAGAGVTVSSPATVTTDDGVSTVTLAPAGSTTTINIVVTSADRSVSQPYTLTVTREQGASYSSGDVIDDTDAFRADMPYSADNAPDGDPWDGYAAEKTEEEVCVQRNLEESTDDQGRSQHLCRFRDDIRSWETTTDATFSLLRSDPGQVIPPDPNDTFDIPLNETESEMGLIKTRYIYDLNQYVPYIADVPAGSTVRVNLVLKNPELSYDCGPDEAANAASDCDVWDSASGFDKSVDVEYAIVDIADPHLLLGFSCRTVHDGCFRLTTARPDLTIRDPSTGLFSFVTPTYPDETSVGDVFITGVLPVRERRDNNVYNPDIPLGVNVIYIRMEMRRYYAGHGEYSPSYSDEYQGDQDYIPNTAGRCDYVEQPWLGCPQGYHDGYDKVRFSIPLALGIVRDTTTGTAGASSMETLAPDTQHAGCAGEDPNKKCPILTLSGDADTGAAAGDEIAVTFSLARGPVSGNQPWQRLTLETMCDPDYELRDENGVVVASSVSFHPAQAEERAFDEWRGDCRYIRTGDTIMTAPTRDDASFDMTDGNPGADGTQVTGPVTWTATLTLPADFSGEWTLSASIDPRLDASGNQYTSLAVANQNLAISAPAPPPASVEPLAPDTQHNSCAGENPHGNCPTLTLSGDAVASPGEEITVTFSLARGAKGGNQPWKRLTLETMCDPDYELRDENGKVVASSESFHLVQTDERAFEDWRGDCRYIRTAGAIMTPPTRDDASFDMTDGNPGTAGTQVLGPITWTSTLTLPADFSGKWTLSASIDPREDASGNRFTSLVVANRDLAISAPAPAPVRVEQVESDTQHNSCAGQNPHGDCPTLTLSGDAVASPGEELTVTFSLARGAKGGNQPWQRLTLETMCDPDYELRDENGNVVASSESFHLVQTEERAFEDWRGDCRYTRTGDIIMTPPTRDDSSFDMTDGNPGTAGTQVLGPITWTSTLSLPDEFSGEWTLSAGIDPREDASGNRFTSLAVANQDLAISD